MARRPASYGEAADILVDLAVSLRAVRRSRRLDLRETADQSGVSLNTLSRIERGRECSVTNAIRLLRWLNHGESGQ
jgi:transcriptional regulator with XRE-family HTH domain